MDIQERIDSIDKKLDILLTINEKKILSPRQAAEYLGITPRMLTHYSKKIGGIRPNSRTIGYSIDDLENFKKTFRK